MNDIFFRYLLYEKLYIRDNFRRAAEKVALFFTLNKAVLFSALNSIFVIDKIIMYNTRRITKCLFQIRFIQEQEIHKQFI